jgi:hypothetical protein
VRNRPWFACDEPERPTDAHVLWHYRDCMGCLLKAQMLAHLYPDDPHVAWLKATVDTQTGGT